MKTKRYPKPKNGAWFIKVRGSYLPSSWQGALTYIPMIAFLVFVMVVAYKASSSIGMVLYMVFPYFVCTGVVMHWLASKKS